jgi:hypothetical protein
LLNKQQDLLDYLEQQIPVEFKKEDGENPDAYNTRMISVLGQKNSNLEDLLAQAELIIGDARSDGIVTEDELTDPGYIDVGSAN